MTLFKCITIHGVQHWVPVHGDNLVQRVKVLARSTDIVVSDDDLIKISAFESNPAYRHVYPYGALANRFLVQGLVVCGMQLDKFSIKQALFPRWEFREKHTHSHILDTTGIPYYEEYVARLLIQELLPQPIAEEIIECFNGIRDRRFTFDVRQSYQLDYRPLQKLTIYNWNTLEAWREEMKFELLPFMHPMLDKFSPTTLQDWEGAKAVIERSYLDFLTHIDLASRRDRELGEKISQ
jgi:hypothetical protein